MICGNYQCPYYMRDWGEKFDECPHCQHIGLIKSRQRRDAILRGSEQMPSSDKTGDKDE